MLRLRYWSMNICNRRTSRLLLQSEVLRLFTPPKLRPSMRVCVSVHGSFHRLLTLSGAEPEWPRWTLSRQQSVFKERATLSRRLTATKPVFASSSTTTTRRSRCFISVPESRLKVEHDAVVDRVMPAPDFLSSKGPCCRNMCAPARAVMPSR